jgi:regulator of replication initiation timing
MSELLSETQKLVNQLVQENRGLKLRNARLNKELDRVTAGWDELKKLARQAPRRRR